MKPHDSRRRLITRRRYRTIPRSERSPGALQAGHVRRIVLTGGPGSGKSTAASFLAREFTDELWVLPEAATMLYRGGLPRASSDAGQEIAQRAIFTVQRSIEDAAHLGHPMRTQLCDRGTVDGAAYWPGGADDFFRCMGTTHERELARYDAVIFLHTAALLPAGYERDLEIRTEDRAEAVELDDAVRALYEPHPRVVHVASRGSFLDKLAAVRGAVADLVADRGSVAPGTRRRPQLAGITGAGAPLEPAPISSLMGLASVSHVLPVD
jgi:hypothetical protein